MSGTDSARGGAQVGLGMALVYAAILVLTQATREETGVVVGIAFAVCYIAPFAFALLAIPIPDVNRRLAVLVAVTAMSLLLAFTSLAGVTLLLLIPTGMLWLGVWRTHRESRCRPRVLPVATSAVLVAAGVASPVLLFRFHEGMGPALSFAPWLLALSIVMALRGTGYREVTA